MLCIDLFFHLKIPLPEPIPIIKLVCSIHSLSQASLHSRWLFHSHSFTQLKLNTSLKSNFKVKSKDISHFLTLKRKELRNQCQMLPKKPMVPPTSNCHRRRDRAQALSFLVSWWKRPSTRCIQTPRNPQPTSPQLCTSTLERCVFQTYKTLWCYLTGTGVTTLSESSLSGDPSTNMVQSGLSNHLFKWMQLLPLRACFPTPITEFNPTSYFSY